MVKSEKCVLRPETWDTGGLENHEESWRKLRYARSGATPLQQDCVFQIWSNTAAATGLFTGHFVRKIPDRFGASTPLLRDCARVNSFGTAGSQHIPDLEQHPYHMLVNSFVRFDHPDLKQHRCYGTVDGSIISLCITTIFFCVAFILTVGVAFIYNNTSRCLHSTEDVL